MMKDGLSSHQTAFVYNIISVFYLLLSVFLLFSVTVVMFPSRQMFSRRFSSSENNFTFTAEIILT